ncbi:M20 family metallopeptidase [Solihabitans fulvus]|uniref:M20 family metallopeptidase n=1 Tax=Solihabitans fulvus TaxID=1892852 RepID=A0A5B2WNZ1_9PSEU|nr:M20/M25/M40 family metallo-hydrolase [Solihabitans fulvus]KAA2252724.1 M20 family metallopeptidase [Solihabitans fulvus]
MSSCRWHDGADHAHILAAAKEDHDSVLDLTRALIRIPSRGGIDPYDPIITLLSTWMSEHDLPVNVVHDATGAAVGLTSEVSGAVPGPLWVLDACLDSAPFGDENAWTHSPTSGITDSGWMWGRGSSDSKVAVAIFCHLAVRLAAATEHLHGTLVLLFDLDEHTGGFGGARQYFEGPDAPPEVAGVMIGYPGMDKLVVGGRGVYRVGLHVHGTSSHSGGSTATPNAIEKASHLVRELAAVKLPDGARADFPLQGKVTVTAMRGGEGYSVTPDLCTINVDVRTTPVFDDVAAASLLERVVAEVDQAWPGTQPTLIEVTTRWPAFALPADSPLRSTLIEAARAFGVDVQPKIAGPSNIGNYLAGLGIPATAGFGVAYTGLHATDERFRTDTVPTVQAIYHAALVRLLGPQ